MCNCFTFIIFFHEPKVVNENEDEARKGHATPGRQMKEIGEENGCPKEKMDDERIGQDVDEDKNEKERGFEGEGQETTDEVNKEREETETEMDQEGNNSLWLQYVYYGTSNFNL